MIVELKSKSGLVKIDSKGAELISFQDVFGVEYIWQKDAKYWGRSSPILFPIVGNLRDDKVIIEGKEYKIPKHGFCRDAEFKVLFQSETKAIFSYCDTEETREVYPYKFNLTLTYSFEDGKLEIGYCVLNQDEKPMDFCIGAHPAFNIPIKNEGDFADYVVGFNKKESDGCPIYDVEKLQVNISNRINLLDEKNQFNLSYDKFDEDAIIFDKLKSDSVSVFSKKTGRGVQLDFDAFDFLAFWTPTKQDAKFLCIEPWCGMAVCSDEDNEFTSKRGVKHLDIGKQFKCKIKISPL